MSRPGGAPIPDDRAAQDVWTTRHVPLAGIETELEKLWHGAAQAAKESARKAAVGSDGGSGQPGPSGLSRARVLNFVAYVSTEPGTADGHVMMINRMVANHPFRTIMVLADERSPDTSMDATVAARALEGADGRKIVHEQVRINARGPVTDGLPSIVLPLLVPDLPTYLWWPGDPPIGHAFWRKMVDACDRLVLDSSSFITPFDSVARLAEFHKTAEKYHTLGDLSWDRLHEWRELVAQFFDNLAYRPYLDRVTSVAVEYVRDSAGGRHAGERANVCSALLLSGWLCARLGWEPRGGRTNDSEQRFDLIDRRNGRVLELILKPRDASTGHDAAAIASIRIESASSRTLSYFEVDQQRNGHVARVTASVPDMPIASRSVSLGTSDLATLLVKELGQVTKDACYEATLAEAGTMAKLALRTAA